MPAAIPVLVQRPDRVPVVAEKPSMRGDVRAAVAAGLHHLPAAAALTHRHAPPPGAARTHGGAPGTAWRSA